MTVCVALLCTSASACSARDAHVLPAAVTSPAGSTATATPAATAATSTAPFGGADAGDAPPPPRVVLHIGDSTVGEGSGLEKALEPRFHALGAKYVHDAWTGISIATVAYDKRVKTFLSKYDPDLVIVTLGANDIDLPSPTSYARHVATIARKVSTRSNDANASGASGTSGTSGTSDVRSARSRDCIWMGPPTWKKDTGIVAVIRDNCAPCRFFDASLVKLERIRDGVHPTNRGGEKWAALFWDFYRGSGASATAIATATASDGASEIGQDGGAPLLDGMLLTR